MEWIVKLLSTKRSTEKMQLFTFCHLIFIDFVVSQSGDSSTGAMTVVFSDPSVTQPETSAEVSTAAVETTTEGWADWAEWSTCTLTCGSGTRTRNRIHGTSEEEESQQAACNTDSCPCDLYSLSCGVLSGQLTLNSTCYGTKSYSSLTDVYVYVTANPSESLVDNIAGRNCSFNLASQFNANGDYKMNFDLPSCIDTTDTAAVKQNGDSVEFIFYAMIDRLVTSSISIQLEETQPVLCSVSDRFEADNGAEFSATEVSLLNQSFSISLADISLFVTDMNQFDKEAPSMIERNSSYRFEWDLSDSMTPETLYVGDKALIYLHPTDFNVYNNFWLALESCKVCKGIDCSGDSVEIIKNACSDGSQLSTFISTPLSTSPDVNTYINMIDSDYSYQLAQITLFQFPETPEITVSCDINLSPKQCLDQYKLSTLFGACNEPSRTLTNDRKRRDA